MFCKRLCVAALLQRFKDKDDYEYQIWLEVFSRSQNIDSPESRSFYLFSLEELSLLPFVKEVTPSHDRKLVRDAPLEMWRGGESKNKKKILQNKILRKKNPALQRNQKKISCLDNQCDCDNILHSLKNKSVICNRKSPSPNFLNSCHTFHKLLF